MTMPEYNNPMRYTPSSRDAMMARTGIGMDRSRSLSLARYRLANVLNTLPNTPSATEIMVMSKKYSHGTPASDSGRHRLMAKYVKIPPSTPTIKNAYRTNSPITDAVDRALFFFAS